MSTADLKKQIADLQARLEKELKEQKPQKIMEVKAIIEEYGITARELGFSEGRGELIIQKSGRAKPAPKYRHPSDPTLQWSGRGVAPKWYRDLLRDGKKPEELAVS